MSTNATPINISQGVIDEENEELLRYLKKVRKDGSLSVQKLRKKLSYSYWILIVMSTLLFLLGMALMISSTVIFFQEAEAGKEVSNTFSKGLTTGGMGIVDLAMLFLMKPFSRIQKLMGEMGQITLLINSYRQQVGLILLGINIKEDPASVQEAINSIQKAVSTTVSAIEQYFEASDART